MFFRIILLLAWLVGFQACFSQEMVKAKADSLYSQQKFTEAFELYDSLYTEGYTSVATLLKMAYIKEGLGDYTKALFYLIRFSQLSPERKVLTKISELADENGLIGYEQSDKQYFQSILLSHQSHIIAVLGVIAIFSFTMIIRGKKKEDKSYSWMAVQAVCLILISLLANSLLDSKQAIIQENQTVLMQGPSGGSESLDVVEKGHLVEIIDMGQVWSQIDWLGQKVYVRTNRLKVL